MPGAGSDISEGSAGIPSEAYLDLYKLAVEMADRISARRTQANAFFLTLQSALVALLGNSSFDNRAIAAAGIVLAASWWLLLRSYRDLNKAKFSVILQMEAELPVEIFGNEWKALKQDPVKAWQKRYAELGAIEKVIPLVCVVGYLVVLIASLT